MICACWTDDPRAMDTSTSQPAREAAYCRDVLGLKDGESEEQLQESLHSEAKELDIDTMGLLSKLQPTATRPESTQTASKELHRRSESIDSRLSQSTGFVSNFSGISREPDYGRRLSRTSISFRDYDHFRLRGRNDSRTSISISPPTTPSHSTFSLPLSLPTASPKKPFRHLRRLSMLKLLRSDSTPSVTGACPHCAGNVEAQCGTQHGLLCEHQISTQALDQTVQSVASNRPGAVSGIVVPEKLDEDASPQEDQSNGTQQWDKMPSSTSAVKLPPDTSRPSLGSRKTSGESKVDSLSPVTSEKLQHLPGFRELQTRNNELNDRFVAWCAKYRGELQRSNDLSRTQMKVRHESATEDRLEHHSNAMAEAEDKQVKAEAMMRDAHAKERRDNATALKHMEAYCAGTYSNGAAHGRSVTEQDLSELEKTRRRRDTMDTEHENSINVLRGEQGRRMRLRAQRQEKEIQEILRSQRKEELELERTCTTEMLALDNLIAEKRDKIRTRWELLTAIFARRAEMASSNAQGEVQLGEVEKRTTPAHVLDKGAVNGEVPTEVPASDET